MANPLLDFGDLPAYDRIRPAHVDPAMRRLLREGERTVARLAADPEPPDWERTVAPLGELMARIDETWAQVEHMCGVVSTEQWQQKRMEWSTRLAGFHDRVGQDARLYRRLKSVLDARPSRLTRARRKVLADAVRDFELSGVALAPADRRRFRGNSERLAALSARFSKNLLDATDAFALWVGEDADLGDLPADIAAQARDSARAHGGDGLRFTLLMSSYIPFMRHCADRDLRAQMHRAHLTRASDLDASAADNRPVISGLLRLRAEQARLLGFPDHVEMRLRTRMAKSRAEVRDFLLGLAGKARPHALRELGALRDFAREHLGIRRLEPWDMAHASDRMRQHQFGYSENAVREYFPKATVIGGLRRLLARLFRVRLRPGAAPLWHRDASHWEVRSLGGTPIGGLFLDLHARESKRSGAWMADAVGRRRVGGRTVRPACHMVCNYPPPDGDGDCLLTLEEVLTLFHEAGHALHHLLTRVDEPGAAGINGVEWDAVELPSQYLESYAWRPDVMGWLSRHRETGRPIPPALRRRILASRRFQGGLRLLRQVELALFDLEIHSDPTAAADVAGVLRRVRRKVSVVRHPEHDRFHCGFDHIFGGGYAAGYYSYLWAEVLAADAFEHAQRLIGREGAHHRAGLPFRRSVLEVGGSRPTAESFAELVGRAPRPEPLLRRYGLR